MRRAPAPDLWAPLIERERRRQAACPAPGCQSCREARALVQYYRGRRRAWPGR